MNEYFQKKNFCFFTEDNIFFIFVLIYVFKYIGPFAAYLDFKEKYFYTK